MARMTSLQDRATIDQLAQLGYTDTQIAVKVGWEVRTVQKWRRRAQRYGRKGLGSKMGRPATGTLSTYPSRLRETLRVWRISHPGWGPKTLRAELEADESFEGQRLPGTGSVGWEFSRCNALHSKDILQGKPLVDNAHCDSRDLLGREVRPDEIVQHPISVQSGL